MDPLELTDRVETLLLTRSVGRTAEALAAAVFGRTGAASIAKVEDAIHVMQDRKSLLGAAYPFGEGSDVVVPSQHSEGWYRTLLLLSHISPAGIERANEVLDFVGERALPPLLGGDCEVISFAWPVRAGVDPRPEGFSEAVIWLGDRLGLKVGHGYRPPRKDGGVDLVAVRRLAGSPLAAPTALVQTTLSHDVRHKARDIDLGLWRTWLDLSPSTIPVLLVPHTVSPSELDEAHGSGVVLLDRVRICELTRGMELALPMNLQAWCQMEWSHQLEAAVERT